MAKVISRPLPAGVAVPVPAPGGGLRRWVRWRTMLAFSLCVPLFVVIGGLVVYPAFYALYLATLNKAQTRFVGLDNFRFLFGRDVFQMVVRQVVVFAVTAVFFKAILGFIAANLVNNLPQKGQRKWRGMMLVPWVIPPALSTLGWWWMFDPTYSALNWLLAVFGGPHIPWLSEPNWARFCVILVNTYLVPEALLFIPLFQIVRKLGLLNTYWSLVVVYPTIAVPFCTWIMIGYFASIPKELDEAALIDGANWLRMLVAIFIPVALPGIIAATIFAFTVSWGAFLYPMAFIYSTDQLVLTAGIVTTLIKGDVFQWGSIMAGALLAAAPPVVVYAFLMDYYIAGLTAGATKG